MRKGRADPRDSEAAPTLTTSDTAELASTRNRGDADCADTSGIRLTGSQTTFLKSPCCLRQALWSCPAHHHAPLYT